MKGLQTESSHYIITRNHRTPEGQGTLPQAPQRFNAIPKQLQLLPIPPQACDHVVSAMEAPPRVLAQTNAAQAIEGRRDFWIQLGGKDRLVMEHLMSHVLTLIGKRGATGETSVEDQTKTIDIGVSPGLGVGRGEEFGSHRS